MKQKRSRETYSPVLCDEKHKERWNTSTFDRKSSSCVTWRRLSVHFPISVLFRQHHQQLFTHSYEKWAALTKGVVVALDKSSDPMTDGLTRLLVASAGDGGVFKEFVQARRHHTATVKPSAGSAFLKPENKLHDCVTLWRPWKPASPSLFSQTSLILKFDQCHKTKTVTVKLN